MEHVRHLMYTVINRGRSEARKLAAETGQETYEPHARRDTMPPGRLADHVGAVRIVPTPGPHKSTKRGFRSNIWMPDQEVQP